MGKRRINLPGLGVTEVETVGFRETGEYWNEYLLDDGTLVRIKLVVGSVYRVPDKYDAEGNPMYVINSTNVVKIDAPDELRELREQG